jgi:hypothetical protein
MILVSKFLPFAYMISYFFLPNTLRITGILTSREGAFEELMRDSNSEAREFFLSCTRLHRIVKAQKFKSMAEHAWMNVEKRLRNVSASVLLSNDCFADYLSAAERLLLFFQTYRELPPAENLPGALISSLRSPLQLSSAEQLIVPLIDSSFHRLLFHAACQYHGLKSRSIVPAKPLVKQRKASVKVIEVSIRKSNKLFGHGISLCSFILNHDRAEARTEVKVDGIEDYVFL